MSVVTFVLGVIFLVIVAPIWIVAPPTIPGSVLNSTVTV